MRPAWPLPLPDWQITYDDQLPRHRSTALSIDLSPIAGFSLEFDTDRLDITTNEICFHSPGTRVSKYGRGNDGSIEHRSERGALLDFHLKLGRRPHLPIRAAPPHLWPGAASPGKNGQRVYQNAWSLPFLHARQPDRLPRSLYALFWRAVLLLQRRAAPHSARLSDCLLYKMVPGQSIMIPPGYAHILINPSFGPALMAGLYSLDSVHDYAPIDSMRGAGYYLVEQDGRENIVANPCYTDLPTLRDLNPIGCIPICPGGCGQPALDVLRH